jgi:hypothetical protein
MPQYATLVDLNENFTKESAIINFTLIHVVWKISRCISLNTLMCI